jgi:DNA-binding MarR family transcriptional regulator
MSGDGDEFDITEVTNADKEFFEAVAGVSGAATTSDLRGATDLTRSQIHYRMEKFEKQGYLNVERPEDADGNTPKTVELTWQGKQVIDTGALDKKTDTNATLAELVDQIKTLQARLEAVEQKTPTDTVEPFTVSQRDAIRYYVEEDISILERTERRFWFEIFPTIAAELGYPIDRDAPATDKYLEEFPYPDAPDDAGPTLAERVDRLEEKIEDLAEKVES